MEWWLSASLLFGSLLVVLASGMPVAFAFLLINLVGVFLLWGGTTGLEQLIFSVFDSVTKFSLLPVPLFVLMGEILFHSKIVSNIFDSVDMWIGRLPGRLSLLAVTGGTLLATLSGSSMASTAVMGTLLGPEMERRGYNKAMYLGPIMGSGGLAMIIPPSGMAVLLGSLAQISIGGLLISGVIPGVMLAALYATYIIIRCYLQPSLAPPYEMASIPLSDKIKSSARNVLPLALIIFLVIGLIVLGVATPTESAALGTLGSFILALCYRGLNWQVTRDSLLSAIQVTVMMFMIITASTAFSQILAFSGAARGLVEVSLSFHLAPIALLIIMQIVIAILGCFIDAVSILMITLPVYMPLIQTTGLNPIWFGLITLINIEAATKTPPFGFLLFVMKGLAPAGTTMGDIYRSVAPFVLIEFAVIGLVIAFPMIALWLPNMAR